MERVGLYAWGGPGTIRLLKTKYHRPVIDAKSFLTLYEFDYLKKVKELFGVTDAWVTYSWGFADATERKDRSFILNRLKNFKRLGIATHAYVQGLNVVTADFAQGTDIFCRDPRGRLLPYSKGRSFICPNSPKVQNLILGRVKGACRENFAGIYLDNVLFGLPPVLVRRDWVSASGCYCRYCQEDYRRLYRTGLPPYEKTGENIERFRKFRVQSVYKLLKRASGICKRNRKQFGINLYDPLHWDSATYFGYNLDGVASLVDYLFIENHSAPRGRHTRNHYLKPLKKYKKPIFVVSYNKSIGFETQFSQRVIDALLSEAKVLGFHPCLKASEYTTNGLWHTIRLGGLRPPKPTSILPAPLEPSSDRISTYWERFLVRRLQPYYAALSTALFENPWLWKLATATGLYQSRFLKNEVIKLK